MGHRCLLGLGETHRSQVGVNWQPQTPSKAKIRIAELEKTRKDSYDQAGKQVARCPFRKSYTSVLFWERRAPAQLQKPRWSVVLPGKTSEHWQWIYETDI